MPNAEKPWKTAAHEARIDRDAVQNDLTGAETKIATPQAASSNLKERVSALKSNAAAVAQQAADIQEQVAKVAEWEAAVSKTEDKIAASTVTEDIWTVEVDIEPGTHRTGESSYDCYWAIYTPGTNQATSSRTTSSPVASRQ